MVKIFIKQFLSGQNLIVKLADFGLSRDTSESAKHYYRKEGGMIPVKWMAPESITYGINYKL